MFQVFPTCFPIFPGQTLRPPRSQRGREADFAQASADATGMAAAMEQLRSEHLAAVQEGEAVEQRRKEDGMPGTPGTVEGWQCHILRPNLDDFWWVL